MKLQLSNTANQKIFTGHGDGYVSVNAERYQRPVAVMAQQLLEWPAQDFASLNESHFAYFLEHRPEVVLLGTGSRQQFPHPRLYRQLTEAGIAVEIMDTPAACRTYNLLVADERKVIAAILI